MGIRIDPDSCSGCGIWVDICPENTPILPAKMNAGTAGLA